VISRTQLNKEVSELTGVPYRQVAHIAATLYDLINYHLVNDEKVALGGVGTLSVIVTPLKPYTAVLPKGNFKKGAKLGKLKISVSRRIKLSCRKGLMLRKLLQEKHGKAPCKKG
jgi:hypothetical protein